MFFCFENMLVEVRGYDHSGSRRPWMFLCFCLFFGECNMWSDRWKIIDGKHVEDRWRSILGESVLEDDFVHIPTSIYMLWWESIMHDARVFVCCGCWECLCVVVVECVHVLKEKGRIGVIVDWSKQIVIELQRFMIKYVASSCLDIWFY